LIEIDDWLDDAALAEFELYREHPDDTHTWCHLQDLQPGSGNRTSSRSAVAATVGGAGANLTSNVFARVRN
jgi:hypothetical protein